MLSESATRYVHFYRQNIISVNTSIEFCASHLLFGVGRGLGQCEHILMAYFHQRRWTQIWTRIQTPFPVVTLYYAELFPLVQIRIRIPVQRFSRVVTVPILGTDLSPKDRSPSLFHTFESGDQTPNLNQWKNLQSTRIRVGI